MCKSIQLFLSMVLCLCFLISGVLPVFAEETAETEPVQQVEIPVYSGRISIRSLEEFLEFAENCRLDSYSWGLLVRLESDIDLSGTEFEGIPIFCGTLEGNGHTISGLNIAGSGSNLGLFRYLTVAAVVQDLNVAGSVLPGGSKSNAGGIAGSNGGRIENCTFSGEIAGGDYIGGIAGANAVTGVIENCAVEGTVYGNHFVGGIAGENLGVIRQSENRAQVNTTARQNSVEISDITMDTLTSSETVSTVTDVGGIAGFSSGVIRDCVNRGDIGYRHMGYNIGGIAGSQSGYLTGCENSGAVSGRKEVGGIVGQMEPLAMVEFTEDALQILEEQLNGLGAAVNRTAANAQNASSQITTQVNNMKGSVQDAADALEMLLPGSGDSVLPDGDSLQAAQNTLTNTMSTMTESLQGMSSAAQSLAVNLNRDLQNLQNQVAAMGATLGNASENLGGTISDVSDLDTELDLSAKVENCVNYGSVLADLNAGGIAGAMSLENDLDPEDDLQVSGDSSLNFDSQLRCVVLNCENIASVTVGKQNAGGIVGWQSLGLVKNCRNTGPLDAEGADYVGGISGQAAGYIRFCSAKCAIAGGAYVGGIAGTGATVSDCRSMVMLTGGTEKLGAVLGMAENADTQEEMPISGNFYLSVGADMGAIDGISYDGQAQSLGMEDFLALEELEDMFRTVSVTFDFEDGTEEVITVATGGSLDAGRIPEVPQLDGSIGIWEGLEDADLEHIYFDTVFHAAYTRHGTTVQSEAAGADGKPVLLAEGTFTGEGAVYVEALEEKPRLEEGQTLEDAVGISFQGALTVTGGRYLLEEDLDAERLVLLVRDSGGSWRSREFTQDGSYLAFALEDGDDALALVRVERAVWPYAAAGAGVLVLAILAAALIYRKKRTQKQPSAEESV